MKARRDTCRAVRDAKDSWFRGKVGSEERLYGNVFGNCSKSAEDWCLRELETSRMKMAAFAHHCRRNNNNGRGTLQAFSMSKVTLVKQGWVR